jgi:hypothetical protein
LELTFLTPMAAIFCVSALLPLAIFWRRDRRASEIRRELDLPDLGWKARAPLVAAVAALPILLGIAAAQPVIGTTRSVPERTDAEALFVIDTSRSMLAASGPNGEERFQRARAVALQLRDRIPQVPAGLATMTDRLLPHALRPTAASSSPHSKSIDIERPPPAFLTQATTYNVPPAFPSACTSRPRPRSAFVVLTDGESRDFGADLERAFDIDPPIETVFVRFWDEGERIYEAGVPEGPYHPLPRSEESLQRAADLVGGRMYDASDASSAADRVEEIVGEGETGSREIAGARLALMPWVTWPASFRSPFSSGAATADQRRGRGRPNEPNGVVAGETQGWWDSWPLGKSTPVCAGSLPPAIAGPITNDETENITAKTVRAIAGARHVAKRR